METQHVLGLVLAAVAPFLPLILPGHACAGGAADAGKDADMSVKNHRRDDSAPIERYFVFVVRSASEDSVADFQPIFLQHEEFGHASMVGLWVARFVRQSTGTKRVSLAWPSPSEAVRRRRGKGASRHARA
jgi:hypothetical protein